MSTYVHNGRTYQAMAQFTGPDRGKQANEYLRRSVNTRLLCDDGTTAVIVSESDHGRAPKQDDNWDQGWTSLLDGGVRYPKEG